MLAQRGRASYTGDRSRNSPDAGAIAVAVLFEAVLEAWQQAQVGRPRRDVASRRTPAPAGEELDTRAVAARAAGAR